jgi:hypothetical protein
LQEAHGTFQASFTPIGKVQDAEVEVLLGYVPVKEFTWPAPTVHWGCSLSDLAHNFNQDKIRWEPRSFAMTKNGGDFTAEIEARHHGSGNVLMSLSSILMGWASFLQSLGETSFFA